MDAPLEVSHCLQIMEVYEVPLNALFGNKFFHNTNWGNIVLDQYSNINPAKKYNMG